MFVVCMLACVQLMCVNSGVTWLTHVNVGLIALVVAIITPTPFFWCLLIGYPLVLSWYSGAPFFLGSWMFATIAALLWTIRTFFVKEDFFSVRFGFLCVATILLPILEYIGTISMIRLGYLPLSELSLWSILAHTGSALVVHTVLLALYTWVEHAVNKKSSYAS